MNRISRLLMAVGVITLSQGIVQPIGYYITLANIEQVEQTSKRLAKDLAEVIASPPRNILDRVTDYGMRKAAENYLEKVK